MGRTALAARAELQLGAEIRSAWGAQHKVLIDSHVLPATATLPFSPSRALLMATTPRGSLGAVGIAKRIPRLGL